MIASCPRRRGGPQGCSIRLKLPCQSAASVLRAAGGCRRVGQLWAGGRGAREALGQAVGGRWRRAERRGGGPRPAGCAGRARAVSQVGGVLRSCQLGTSRGPPRGRASGGPARRDPSPSWCCECNEGGAGPGNGLPAPGGPRLSNPAWTPPTRITYTWLRGSARRTSQNAQLGLKRRWREVGGGTVGCGGSCV